MRIWLWISGVAGALGVAGGALAAHPGEGILTPPARGRLETASGYALAHAPALLGVAWLHATRPGWPVFLAGGAFTAGLVLFCGVLAAAALLGATGLMPIVPVGGGAFILGWLAIAAAGLGRTPTIGKGHGAHDGR